MFAHLEAHWHSGKAFWPEAKDVGTDVSAREQPILITLSEIVQRHGDRPAVQDDRQTLSFHAMWNSVAHLAGEIQAIDTRPDPIAIMLPADATYLPAFLACLAVGRTSVLLDAGAPRARNIELIRRTGASLVLGAGTAAEIGGVPILAVRTGTRPGPAEFPKWPPAFDADAPALILCTSGSTGNPKAIVHSQRTIMQRAWCHANAIGLRPDDFCLSLSPPATLGGINGLLTFSVVGAGSRCVDLRVCGLSGLLDLLMTLPVTSLRAPPSVIRILPTLPDARKALAGLRNVTTYGEAVLRADIAALRSFLPETATIFGAFGSTESGGMGWYPSADDAFDATRTPAGWLMPDIEAIILDDDGDPCGPDAPGELVVRSRYNALGEWRDGHCVPGELIPDKTDPSKRIHRTGDVARRSADGVFLVVGRNDRMIKVNGQRVEPAEIEDAIRSLPGVMECAVVSRDQRGVAVTAYVVLRPGTPTSAVSGFGTALRGLLPNPMVPSRFVAIAALPLLPGGKVDHLALRGPATSSSPQGVTKFDVRAEDPLAGAEKPAGHLSETTARRYESFLESARSGDFGSAGEMLNDAPELVFISDREGRTALHEAAYYGHNDVVELLLTSKAKLDAVDDDGWTPLHSAVCGGHKQVVKLLLANDADANARTSRSWTPLLYAARNGQREIIELLLANGADVSARTDDGNSALLLAVSGGHKDIAELLLADRSSAGSPSFES